MELITKILNNIKLSFKQNWLFFYKILSNDLFIISITYMFAYGLILFNNGVFWDDWVLYNMDKRVIIDTFKQTGSPWIGYFHVMMLSFKESPICYHLLVFLCYYLTAIFLYFILKHIKEIDSFSRLVIVLFFVLFPVNSARIAMIDAPYGICNFLFFFGFWLMVRYYENKKLFFRITSLLTLFLSFITNSLLVFYALIIFYILYHERVDLKQIFTSANLQKLVKISDYLCLPFIFWFVKVFCFTPFGLYEGYNQLNLKNLLLALFLSLFTINTSFIEVLDLSLSSFSVSVFIGAILLSIIISKRKFEIGTSSSNDLSFFILGLIIFFLGVIPYIAVNRFPMMYDWDSRHQLLVPLGASFILFYGLRLVFNNLCLKPRLAGLFMILLITTFIKMNFNIYIDYQRDWYKQLSIIENMKLSDVIRNHRTFIFKDNTLDLNGQRRRYRFYEYAGLLKYSFGNQSRFGIDYDEYHKMEDYQSLFNEHYNLKDYKKEKPDYFVYINRGSNDIRDFLSTMRLKYYELFKPKQFLTQVKRIVKFSYKKYDPESVNENF